MRGGRGGERVRVGAVVMRVEAMRRRNRLTRKNDNSNPTKHW